MDHPPRVSQNPYASPAENAASDIVGNASSLSESPIHYSGIVTREEVVAAHRLATRGSWLAIRTAIARFILYLFSLMMLALAASGIYYHDYLLGAIVLALFLIFFPMLLRRAYWKMKANNMQRRNLGCYQFTEGIIREDGFLTKVADASTAIQWSYFKGLRYNDTVIVLFYAKQHGYCFFGRSKFATHNDWQRLIDFLKREFPRLNSSKTRVRGD